MKGSASRGIRIGLGVVVFWVSQPALGWTWGSDGHHYIARNYSQHLPPQIDGLRTWDGVVDQHVMDPDFRKSSVSGEAPRHFMDIDSYPEFAAGTLPHERATLEARYGASTVLANGVLPWAVGEVTETLTRLFQEADWDSLALEIADLCHYVGDGHQPLHCMRNYDGQYTGNNGIHARYETTMLSMFIGQLSTSPAAVSFYPSPVDAMFDIITDSWNGKDTILNGDNTAKAMSGGSYNTLYYQALWHETETLTDQRLDEASRATASFVYTAWIDAGSPAVPGSTVEAPPMSPGTLLATGPSPFRDQIQIDYAAPVAVALDVVDVRGTRIDRLVSGASGSGTAVWRPRSSGRAPGAGLYFLHLHGPGVDRVTRVVFVP